MDYKTIIVGEIVFADGVAKILDIAQIKVCHEDLELDIFLDEIEDSQKDWLILENCELTVECIVEHPHYEMMSQKVDIFTSDLKAVHQTVTVAVAIKLYELGQIGKTDKNQWFTFKS